MRNRAFEGRSWAVTAAASCIATVVILGGATAGGSRATAGDPDEAVGEPPAAAMQAFEPALPTGPGPAALTISGVEVGARLVGDGPGSSIEVALHNPGAAQRAVACEVVLERVAFGEVSPMARMMPPPQISTVHRVPINVSLRGGERRTTVERLTEAALAPGGPRGTLRLAIRERT